MLADRREEEVEHQQGLLGLGWCCWPWLGATIHLTIMIQKHETNNHRGYIPRRTAEWCHSANMQVPDENSSPFCRVLTVKIGRWPDYKIGWFVLLVRTDRWAGVVFLFYPSSHFSTRLYSSSSFQLCVTPYSRTNSPSPLTTAIYIHKTTTEVPNSTTRFQKLQSQL